MTKQLNTALWKIYTSAKGIVDLFCKGLNEICMCSRDSWLTQFDSESCQRCLLHLRGGWKWLTIGCSSLEGCSWGTCKTPTTPPPKAWGGPSRVVLAPCRSGWEGGRPCVSLGHFVALRCIFVFSPAFVAWTAMHWNLVQYVRFIILRTTDMLLVACTCICYAVMPVRSKLPSSMVHPSLAPSATIGTEL